MFNVAEGQFQEFEQEAAAVELALSLGGSLDEREVIHRVLDAGIRVVGADRATLSSLFDRHGVVEATVGAGGEIEWIGQTFTIDQAMAQPAVAAALRSLSPSFAGGMDLGHADPRFAKGLRGVHHTATLPLVHADQAVGMLVLSRYDDRPFTGTERGSMDVLGTVAGMALRNARLHSEAQASARRLEATVEAAREAAAATNAADVLDSLTEHARRAAGADGGSFARVEDGCLVLEATTGAAPIGSRWAMAPQAVEALSTLRATQLAASDYRGRDPAQVVILSSYAHFLIVPVMAESEPLGLFLLGRHSPEPFSAADILAVEQVAGVGGLLLRNARLLRHAHDAERSKAEFMSMAAHQMRSPITVIRGYASLLEETLEGVVGEPGLLAPLRTIEEKGEELDGLVAQLLLTARVESGTLEVAPREMDAAAVAASAVDRVRPRATLVRAQLQLSTPAVAPAFGDPALVESIIDNLLNNALVYGAEGSRPARVKVTVASAAGSIRITVADRGPGVPEAERGLIFEAYRRGTGAELTRPTGSGLGLYLSRRLARTMGGDVHLERQRGRGAAFTLSLPAPA